MKLENIIKSVNVCETRGNVDKEIKGIQMDSRLIEAGHLFVAVKGTQTDGHAYIAKAIEKGATAIVCETLPEELNENVTYVTVADTEDAVGKLATTFYGDPTSKLDLVGVTGTNGKLLSPPYYIICSANSDIRWGCCPLSATTSTEKLYQQIIQLPILLH